jgi:CRISPR-associated protein Cas2
MLIVVSYDIPNDRRRTRLAHALKDFGERVQYSVFECRLDAEQLGRLSRRIKAEIDPEEDRVRIYPLCLNCERQVEIQGSGKLTKDPEAYYL